MDLTEVRRWVETHSTEDDLRKLQSSIKYRREHLGRLKAEILQVGDLVSFSTRNGTQIQGRITKKLIKNFRVKQTQGEPNYMGANWTVPPALLTKVES